MATVEDFYEEFDGSGCRRIADFDIDRLTGLPILVCGPLLFFLIGEGIIRVEIDPTVLDDQLGCAGGVLFYGISDESPRGILGDICREVLVIVSVDEEDVTVFVAGRHINIIVFERLVYVVDVCINVRFGFEVYPLFVFDTLSVIGDDVHINKIVLSVLCIARIIVICNGEICSDAEHCDDCNSQNL